MGKIPFPFLVASTGVGVEFVERLARAGQKRQTHSTRVEETRGSFPCKTVCGSFKISRLLRNCLGNSLTQSPRRRRVGDAKSPPLNPPELPNPTRLV